MASMDVPFDQTTTEPGVVGQALILQTDCPDKLQDFKEKILDKLKFDDVLKR